METTTQVDAVQEIPPAARADFRGLCLWILAILTLATIVAVRAPAMTVTVRAIIAANFLFALFTILLYLGRFFAQHPRALYPAVFFLGLFITWCVLGNKPPEVPNLRSAYVKRIELFEGVRYRWGGEIVSGIDCSGLARSAMWQAMLFEGTRSLNPGLLGTRLWGFWWRDVTARDMLEGKYGFTKVVGHAKKLAGYDTILREKGDLAVTDDGIHVLIYCGDGRWAEASPDDGKVVINKAPADSDRPYFNVPVTFVRWTILDDEM